MKEHVHEWALRMGFEDKFDKFVFQAVCMNCGVVLGQEQVERRLNATERLRKIPCKCPSKDKHFTICAWWALERAGITYADILEEE